MAATSTKFAEDGTTELTFADGVVTRVPSAILYDQLGNPLITAPADGQANTGVMASGSMGWDPTTSTWYRLRTAPSGGGGGMGSPPLAVQLMARDDIVSGSWLQFEAPVGDGLSASSRPTTGAKYGYNGATWDRQRIATIFKNIAAQSVTAGTPVDIWTPAAGKSYRLLGFMLSLTVVGSVILKDHGTPTEILRTSLMAAGIGLASPPMGNGLLGLAVNNKLAIDVSATGSVSGFVFGTEE